MNEYIFNITKLHLMQGNNMKQEDFDEKAFKRLLEVIYDGNGKVKYIKNMWSNHRFYSSYIFTKEELEYFIFEELVRYTSKQYSKLNILFTKKGTGFILVSDRFSLKNKRGVLHIDRGRNVSINEIHEFLNSVYEEIYVLKED